MYALQQGGTIRLNHFAKEGQTWAKNNDFGCHHTSMVTGQRLKKMHVEKSMGSFHSVPMELQMMVIMAARESTEIEEKIL